MALIRCGLTWVRPAWIRSRAAKIGQGQPRAAQDRPRARQERPRAAQERPKSGQERPKSGPRAPKSRQDWLRSGLGAILGQFSDLSWAQNRCFSLCFPILLDKSVFCQNIASEGILGSNLGQLGRPKGPNMEPKRVSARSKTKEEQRGEVKRGFRCEECGLNSGRFLRGRWGREGRPRSLQDRPKMPQ